MRLIDADELLKKPLDTANYPSNFVREAKTVEAVSLSVLKDKMLKYGFTAPDMTVTEFVEDFESL